MYVIITYDVGEKRVHKVNKKLKQYLTWTQNSVFEGVITKGSLVTCLNEIDQIIRKDHDSLYVYQINNPNMMKKIVYGHEKNFEDMFLLNFRRVISYCNS